MGVDFIWVEFFDDVVCVVVVVQVCECYGLIYGFVNNVGVNDGVGLDCMFDVFCKSLDQNFVYYFIMLCVVVDDLCVQWGVVVNISFKIVLIGQGGILVYVVVKVVQLGLMCEWVVEFLFDQVCVNVIVVVEVMMLLYCCWLDSMFDLQVELEVIIVCIFLGKCMMIVCEIVDICVFLLLDCVSYIIGQWLYVDGGYLYLDCCLN